MGDSTSPITHLLNYSVIQYRTTRVSNELLLTTVDSCLPTIKQSNSVFTYSILIRIIMHIMQVLLYFIDLS